MKTVVSKKRKTNKNKSQAGGISSISSDEESQGEEEVRKTKTKKKKSQAGRTQKCKTFHLEWLSKSIKGVKVDTWLAPHPSLTGRAQCKVCPKTHDAGFCFGEGWASIKQHGTLKGHEGNLTKSKENPQWKKPLGTMTIMDGFKKAERQNVVKKHSMEELLQSEVKYCFSMSYHGASGRTVACASKLIPALFGRDCVGAKQWTLGRTKFSYLVTDGLFPYFKGKVEQAMKAKHFSLNFDESEVNGQSLLDLNSSYINEENLVEKRLFSAIPVEVLKHKDLML